MISFVFLLSFLCFSFSLTSFPFHHIYTFSFVFPLSFLSSMFSSHHVYLSTSFTRQYFKGLVLHLPAVRPGATPSDEREWCERRYFYSPSQPAAIKDIINRAAHLISQLTPGFTKTSGPHFPQLQLRRRCMPQLRLNHPSWLPALRMSSSSLNIAERPSSSVSMSSSRLSIVERTSS